MQPLSIGEIISATGGKLLCGDESTVIDNIAIDSRKADSGLFVPLKGENSDGHDYIDKAFQMGAIATLTDREISLSKNVVLVPDTYKAIGDIARFYREKYTVKTVAVVGSVGKTTTKDMLAGVLGTKLKVQKTQGNFNNHLGVPLTIFTVEDYHEVLVLEMGMSNFGEIDYLAGIGKPDIAVMTNIGTSHIENLGSRANIFKAKSEVLKRFTSKNLLIANGDDEFLQTANGDFKIELYGIENPENNVFAKDIKNLGIDGTEFTICDGENEYKARVKVPGIHNVYNALAAYLTGRAFGISPCDIVAGLQNCEMTKMRMEIEEVSGMTVIKDFYNAAPDSIKAALAVLRDTKAMRKVAVLGDVLEMGEFAEDAHRALGDNVKLSADVLITAGKNAKFIAERAGELGVSCFTFSKTEDAAKFCKTFLKTGDAVLIKASRGMKFETIYERIK